MAVAQVDVIHFYPQENAENHHTKRYESVNQGDDGATTIVRRGQPFSGIMRLKRPFDEENDVVQFVFTLGDKPKMDTQGSMYLRREADTSAHNWSARLTDVQDDNINIFFEISSPVTAPIGVWNVRVITRRKDSQDREIYDFDSDLYILFNPWNCEDQTYMNESELLQEYVLNDVGKIWQGVNKKPLGRSWLFGQFDEIVLPACMFVLDRAEVPFNQRGDPVILSRAISKIVNSNDDQGVLVGRWDMEYDDGTAPTDWTGSVDILQQYLETATEVRYGQCWVFAAVVTTICRALGIPSRVVTNLVSAHDANSTLSVDKYYSEDMVPFDDDPNNPNGVDSIWSYHVWSDVWMARPDLPNGYGGWQAIDATPQETSSGFFQCGPASLQAIKQGVTGLGYDVGFMLASVNADLLRWRRNPDEESGWSVVDTNSYHIGRIIITKKPYIFDPNGDADMDDITDQYKNREGTAAERVALMNGVRQTPRAKRYYSMLTERPNDVSFHLLDIDTISIGEPFRIAVDVDNNSDEPRNIKAVLTANSVFYNGVKGFQIKKTEGKIHVGPKKHDQISIEVSAEEYLPKLVEYGNLKISAMAMVEETVSSWADDDDVQVHKPTICIKFNDDLIINQPTSTVLFFTNPLDRPLTNCQFRLSSSGIVGRTLRGTIADVDPKGKVEMELPVQPNKLGPVNFVATFKSAELSEITGAAAGDVIEG